MAKAKKPVGASGKHPKKNAAANETVIAVATASAGKPTFEYVVLVLTAFFQSRLASDSIGDKTDVRSHFPISEWLGLVPAINGDPAIRKAGLSISSEYMKNARTIDDIAVRLFSGAGKTPERSPIRESRTTPPLVRSATMKGTVQWFNAAKGTGFVRPDHGGDDLFVHISALEKAGLSTLSEGQKVEYKEVAIRGKTSVGNLRVTDSSSDQPALASSFFFQLEGKAQGDEALWGQEFDLRFLHGQVSGDALAIVKGTKFDPVEKGEVALGVEVVPKGLTLARGDAFRLVQFKDGAMVGEPPRFALKAPDQADADDEPAGFYVNFSVTELSSIAFSWKSTWWGNSARSRAPVVASTSTLSR